MPYPFDLPTTSQLNLQTNLTSSTHPSLPSATTSHRSTLRSALKSHKRLPTSSQPVNLPVLLSNLSTYLPYLLTLDCALSSRPVAGGGEHVDLTLTSEVSVEWRSTLAKSALPTTGSKRIPGRGLDYEIHSALHTLATIHSLLARQALLALYAAATPTPDARLASIQTASKHLQTANSIHLYLVQRTHGADGPPVFPAAAIDLSTPVQSALADLAHAEATLLFVLKDDPYPALVIQSRNKNDREWMVGAPRIPKLRVGLLARLCLAAAERAGMAAAGLTGVDAALVTYVEDLRRTARAKACRFLGIERDMEGSTGEGIAWLRGGMGEVGVEVVGEGKGKVGMGLGRLKSGWSERREDRRVEKGKGSWGMDAGMAEEGRVLEWLERRWSKMNDTVNVQVVPDWRPLVAKLPSGRDALSPKAWVPTLLGEDDLARMRAPVEAGTGDFGDDSSDEQEGRGGGTRDNLPGAFPDTRQDYY